MTAPRPRAKAKKARSRGDGATTRAMQIAPHGSHYVWVNGHLDYPKRLAHSLGRDDLIVVSPDWFSWRKWRGTIFQAIVVDHAAQITDSIREAMDSCARHAASGGKRKGGK